MEIKIKYHDDSLPRLERFEQGNWIDLRASESVCMRAGEFKIIPLGVSIELPKGYEAHLAPRSSTFKKWKILQTNGVGIIDTAYCGDNDVWGFPAFALEDTVIEAGSRIAQFRIMKTMEPVDFVEVEHLSDQDRGGFGSTGSK